MRVADHGALAGADAVAAAAILAAMRAMRWPGSAARPLILIGTLLVAGCSGTTSGGPSASPATPSGPTPTASSLSPEATFRRLVASDDWALIADLGGELMTSAEANDVYINPVHGVVQLAGGDAHLVLAAPDATGIRVIEEIRIDGRRSARGPDGAWQAQVSEPTGTDLLGVLLTVPPVHADGTEVVDGRRLTILAADEPVIVGSIGEVRAAEPDATADLTFAVDDDGYPVRIRFDLVPPRDGIPAVEHLELVVAPGPEPVDIDPSVDWTTFDSTRGYSVLMPATCEQLEGDEHWEDFQCGQRFLRIWTFETDDSAATWTDDSIAAWSRDVGVQPAVEDTLRVGSGASGTDGLIATYRYAEGGTDVTMSDGVFVQGGTGYDVVVLGPRENEAGDRAFFLQVLATMRFER
jgi:hypothetical protein